EAVDKYADIICEHNMFITLGGGEPTLHKDFWKILNYSMGKGKVWLATNGSVKETAMTLCEMARKGHVAVALSQDKWHDPIDPDVVECFSEGLEPTDCDYYTEYFHPKRDEIGDLREVRSVKVPIRGGRAATMTTLREGCPCPGVQVKVDGGIYTCGCEDAPNIGTVKDGIKEEKYRYYNLFEGCFKGDNPLMEEV
ncbi:unnamed protein product, partial [marine sediment metagenome]